MAADSSKAIQEWWTWFTANQERIQKLEDPEDPFWDEVVSELQKIDENLFFVLSGSDDDEVREFIITAEGNIDLFPLVETIVTGAPEAKNWQFVALKPPMGFDFEIHYEGVHFDPQAMWFLPMRSESKPELLGVRVGIPDLAPGQEEEASTAAFIILDAGIGERAAAEDIAHIEVTRLPKDPEAEGFIELHELEDYIAYVKRGGDEAEEEES